METSLFQARQSSSPSPVHKRILSGIQPSGVLTLGNYLGAVRNWVDLQEIGECFFCIVDYHAITAGHDPACLAEQTMELAADLLACGLDPERCALFIQSQVPEHTELAWILSCSTAYGDLKRMTQFKDKSQDAEFISAGLFLYPVLQAADILAYRPHGVPVGEDQAQHLELTREVARRFNALYGDTFPDVETILTPAARIMSPADPSRKMSKSAGEKHYIALFESEESIRAKVRSHVTDSGPGEADGSFSPGVRNLLGILGAVAPVGVTQKYTEAAREGRILYSELKQSLTDHLLAHLAPLRARRQGLTRCHIREILLAGAERAQAVARDTMSIVRERVGIVNLSQPKRGR